MKVLVTGAGGFLGSHLVDRLLKSGNQVTGIDNWITGNPKNLSHLRGNQNFELFEEDVCNLSSFKSLRADTKYDRIYHLACPASPADYADFPIETMMVSSVGTKNCIELALQHKARFFLASTSEVYGDPSINPQHESYWGNVNPIGPRSMYDEAKRFAEAMTSAYVRSYGLDARIIRIFNTYGPRMRPGDGRVIPNFISQALTGKPVTIYGEGKQTRSFCFVNDLVSGIVLLMESTDPAVVGKPCNIGNPREMSMNDLVEAIEAVIGHGVAKTNRPFPEDDPKMRRPDIELARRALGWEPKVRLEDGIKITIDWFKEELETL